MRLTTTHRGHCPENLFALRHFQGVRIQSGTSIFNPSDGGMGDNTPSLVVHEMQITFLSNCNHTLLERFITRNQLRHTSFRVMISEVSVSSNQSVQPSESKCS